MSSIIEQLCSVAHDIIADNNDHDSTSDSSVYLQLEDSSPLSLVKTTLFSQKLELPDCVDEVETRIHKWLDQQGILMANPSEKEEQYYDVKRNNIWASYRNSVSSNNISSMSQLGAEESILSPKIRSPKLSLLSKLSSNSDITPESDIPVKPKKNDSLFERRKGRMNTMQVGSPINKPSIYSQCRALVQES